MPANHHRVGGRGLCVAGGRDYLVAEWVDVIVAAAVGWVSGRGMGERRRFCECLSANFFFVFGIGLGGGHGSD